MADLYVHGKTGKVCAIVGDVVAIPVGVICLPVTVPVGLFATAISEGGDPGSWRLIEVPWVPIALVQDAFYCAGALLCYPGHLVIEKPLERRADRALADEDREQVVSVLLRQMPQITRRQYGLLTDISGRGSAPANKRERGSPGGWRGGTWVDDVLEDMLRPVLFGKKPVIGYWVEREWKAWDAAGRPAGAREEARFCLDYWLRGGGYLPDEKNALVERILAVSWREAIHYWREFNPEELSMPSMVALWEFWINGHGGVDAVLDERFGAEGEKP